MAPRPDLIDTLGLVLTSDCNRECAYCYQDRGRRGPARWRDVAAALDWGLGHAGDHLQVTMTGGEPLLARDLVYRVLDHVPRAAPDGLSVDLRIMTNGVLLDEETFTRLVAAAVEIRLSSDGVAPAQDWRGRGSFADHDARLDRLARCDRRAFHDGVVASMTVMPATVPHLAAGVSYLLGKGFGRIELGPVLTPCPGWDDAEVQPLRDAFRRLGEICLDHYQRTAEVPLGLMRQRPPAPDARPRAGPVCSAALTRNPTMDVDGRWYSCALFARSVRRPDRIPAVVTEAACWGRPGAPGFRAAAAGAVPGLSVLPVFRHQVRREGLYGPCDACEHVASCRICPLVLLPDQLGAVRQRVPGFVCAFNAAAAEARSRFPGLPAPAAAGLLPQVWADREAAFLAAAAALLPPESSIGRKGSRARRRPGHPPVR